MKSNVRWSLFIFVIFLLTFTFTTVNGQTNYEINYIDPSNDVREFGDEGSTNTKGYEDIDILETESSKALIKQDIIFKIKVAGKIKVADNFFYGLYILNGETEVYVAVYQNGTCLGINLQNNEITEDILFASGANTDTLQITIPIKNFGVLPEFDFYAYTSTYEETDDFIYEYLDFAPDQELEPDDINNWDYLDDKILYITEPLNGSTIYQIINIHGIVDTDENVEYVEIQIDTDNSHDWHRAVSSNSWQFWSYQWNTAQVTNGKHVIRSRAFNGTGYFYDNITVFIDQTAATNPEVCLKQGLNVGDKFDYELNSLMDTSDIFEGASVSGELTFEVSAEKKVEVNGTTYDAFIVETYSKITLQQDIFSSDSTIEETVWLRTSDLAIIKEDMVSTSKVTGFGMNEEIIDNVVSIYEPPIEKYRFPLKVGDKWESVTHTTIKSTSTMNSESQTETDKNTQTYKFECLRTETIVLPLGTFETYLVYNSGEFIETMEPEDEMDEFDIEIEESSSIESPSGYTIDYYSPELGYFVKTETYDANRELLMSFELVSYEHKTGTSDTKTSDVLIEFGPGFEIPIELCFFSIVILIIIIIFIILIIRRRGKLMDDMIIQDYNDQVNQRQLEHKPQQKQQARTEMELEQPSSGSQRKYQNNIDYDKIPQKRITEPKIDSMSLGSRTLSRMQKKDAGQIQRTKPISFKGNRKGPE